MKRLTGPTDSLYYICGLAVLCIAACLVSHHEYRPERPEGVPKQDLGSLLQDQSLRFIANHGQAGPDVQFHVQALKHSVLFEHDLITLRQGAAEEFPEVTLQFAGANPQPVISGQEPQPGVAHFYKGRTCEGWYTEVPTYACILYEELYPGINMAYVGHEGVLESEFYVSPYSDYRQIRLVYSGVESQYIREDGALVLRTNLGDFVESPPYVFQEINGVEQEIKATYVQDEDGTIGFDLDDYDVAYAVVIDPELVFLETINGAILGGEFSSGAVMDSEGNVIMAGAANRFFPATDTIPASNHEGGLSNDCLLMKLDGRTGEVLYSALLGGSQRDFFYDVMIDSMDNLTLTGITKSEDFPVLNAFQDTLGGSDDAFLVSIDAAGELTQSTYLGGSQRDWARALSSDGHGCIYLAGRTTSTDFPVQGAFQPQNNGGINAFDDFVAKFNATGDSLIYATYLGGSGDEEFGGFAVNAAGEATLAGSTVSPDFPTQNAVQDTFGGGKTNFGEGDLFITRFNAAGDGLIFSTYYGGSGYDWSFGLALNDAGEVVVTGGTESPNFPVVDGQSFPEADTSDGVLVHLDHTGQVVYALRSNLPGHDAFRGVAVDASQRIVVVGGQPNVDVVVYDVSAEGSVRNGNNLLKAIFDFESPGHSVNAVEHIVRFAKDFTDEFLLFSMTRTDTSSISQASVASIRLTELFDVTFENGCVNIKFRGPNMVGLKVSSSDDGFLTINGAEAVPQITATQVEKIAICGSSGDDEIDLREFNNANFPNAIAFSFPVSVEGKAGNDVVRGSTDKRNLLLGGEGNDELIGGRNDDRIEGGSGDDVAEGGDGEDGLFGDEGHDELYGGDDEDEINGGPGNDFMEGGSGRDGLCGDSGDDIMNGGKSDDIIVGGTGDDLLFGGDGDDELNGGDGKDVLDGQEGWDGLNSGPGDDITEVRDNDEEVDSGVDNDLIKFAYLLGGTPGVAQQDAGKHHNEDLQRSSNALRIIDSMGIDTLDFTPTELAVSLDLTLLATDQTIDTAGSAIHLDGIFEVAVASNFDDVVTAGPLVDVARHLDGGTGVDTLFFKVDGAIPVDDGSTITTDGYADVTYVNFEVVVVDVVNDVENPMARSSIPVYPNPFVIQTDFHFTIAEHGPVRLGLYTLEGDHVITLVDRRMTPGDHSVRWDGRTSSGRKLATGVYVYLLDTRDQSHTGKLILLE